MENKLQGPVFFEDVTKDKVFIGAAPVFDKRSLVFKRNKSGVMGGHAARAFKANELIIYIEHSGTLSKFRAIEETQGLLSVLGAEKYSLPDNVIIAIALYKRFYENNKSDILFATVDIRESYLKTPMSVLHRVEFGKFLYPNNKVFHWEAELVEGSIRRIGLDLDFFYLCLAYVISRAWGEGVGILPVVDAFNASHGGAANTYFKSFDNKHAIFADRDIEAGEEITWNYNSVGALETFTGYGYIDANRLYSCEVVVRIESNDIDRFVEIYNKCFDFLLSQARQSEMDFFDVYEYKRKLIYPGPESRFSKRAVQISESIESYYRFRRFMRVMLLVREGLDYRGFSESDSAKHISIFGIEFEMRCLDSMIKALKNSNDGFSKRVQNFRDGTLGSMCDIQPICDIFNYTYTSWLTCLAFLQKLLASKSIEDASIVIAHHVSQEVDSGTLKSFLERNMLEATQLELVLANEILKEKKFF